MSDDIDIEEHDPMDNPRIKNIFSDIASIKNEVIDYEEDENVFEGEDFRDYPPNRPTEDMELDNFDLFDVPHRYSNMIILGSKPVGSDLLSEREQAPSDNESTPENETKDQPTIYPSSVVLDDWGVMLKNSNCFCKECNILFPTENAIDSHRMSAHSFLEAVSKNKAVKSTAKSSLGYRKVNSNNEAPKFLCSHCNEVFPDENAFLKHSYELIPNKFTTSPVTVMSNACPVCFCVFKTSKTLEMHAQENHNLLNFEPAILPFSNKCVHCPSVLHSIRSYNAHVCKLHSKLFKKKMSSKDKFKCLHCDLAFPSVYSKKIHRATAHPHLSDDKSSPKSEKMPSKSSIDANGCLPRLVPKSTLFKCNKCQIHFITCSAAMEHSKRCNLSKGDWKCQICRRAFKMLDRVVHSQQHELTNQFNVIVVHENLLKKIICRCDNCKICYDERLFLKLHLFKCVETKSVECKTCHLKINEHSISKHLRFHTQLKVNDFIIIDYVSKINAAGTISKINSTSNKAVADVKRLNYKVHLTYCNNCKCYGKRVRVNGNYHKGDCKLSAQEKVLCKLCGLQFTGKGFLSHKEDHKKSKLELCNFHITDLQNKMRINPPMPNFKCCERCQVHFVTSNALKKHVCEFEEYKDCELCGQKFSDLAHKIHLPFHQFSSNNQKESIPELMKKYESMKTIWNILYRCNNCDIVTDSYDRVVEHCQDHYCNTPKHGTIVQCEICELKLAIGCYERHEKLHITSNINRKSFEILEYQYNTLLTDNWLKMFKGYSDEQVQQILSKSIYNVTRNIRMELVADGLTELTVYVCQVCFMVVEPSSILDHANTVICPKPNKKYYCSLCRFTFLTAHARMEHKNLHTLRPEETFRIVSFNNKTDSINNTLLKLLKTDEFKFIRCQHCGKLINKSKYNAHIAKHRNSKAETTSNKLTRHEKFVPKKINQHNPDARKVRLCYSCRLCNISGFKRTFKTHICSDLKSYCNKCQMWFRRSSFNKHLKLHVKHSNLVRKNLSIIYFKNGVIDNSAHANKRDIKKSIAVRKAKPDKIKSNSTHKKIKLQLYQCLNCLSCLHTKQNIMRHLCMLQSYSVKCNICEFRFLRSHMYQHKLLHNMNSFSKKDISIVKFNSKGGAKLSTKYRRQIKYTKGSSKHTIANTDIQSKAKKAVKTTDSSENKTNDLIKYDENFQRMTRVRIYKCSLCLLHFVVRANLLEHMTECRGEEETGEECDSCKITYYLGCLKLHKSLFKCGEKDLILLKIDLDLKESDRRSERNWLYYCAKCDVHSVTHGAMMYHLEYAHRAYSPNRFCEQCGITFFARAYTKHLSLHHSDKPIPISKLNVEKILDFTINAVGKSPMKSYSLRNGKRQSLETDLDVTGIDNSVQTSKKKPRTDYNRSIYKCHVCDVHFISLLTLRMHLLKNTGKTQHLAKRYHCDKCNLMFSKNSIKDHKYMHNYGEDFKVVTLDHVTNLQRNANDESRNTLSESNVTDDETQNNIEEPVTSVSLGAPSSVSAEVVQDPVRIDVKLYKCYTCDVYFTDEESCSEHCQNHTVLDPTEYIACKICDLQFLCDSLGRHMKGHKEKKFNVDELIVTEYRVDGSDVKIETYSAADVLRLKQVTTTTHSDND